MSRLDAMIATDYVTSTNGLNAWKREAKTMLDTLDAIEAAYVRGAVNDKAAALKAVEITAAG